MLNKHQTWAFRAPSYAKIINLAFSRATKQKRGEIYIFDGHFVFCSYEVNVTDILDFFRNLLVSMYVPGSLSYFK